MSYRGLTWSEGGEARARRWGRRVCLVLATTASALVALLGMSLLGCSPYECVSVTRFGMKASGSTPSISADGRYVAFSSSAKLVRGDTNKAHDVFVRDRVKGRTRRISVAADGTQGNGSGYYLAMSADGRYVVFHSSSKNLLPGGRGFRYGIYVCDRLSGTIECVDLAPDGGPSDSQSQGPVISANGRYVAFHSKASNLVSGDANGKCDVFVHDRVTGKTERVSVSSAGLEGDADSYAPALSADGRYVAFDSTASNLVPEDTNSACDVFVHDRATGKTERVSVGTDGSEGDYESSMPSISADGRYVAFASPASTLAPGDTNETWDVFVRDREARRTERIPARGEGVWAEASCAAPAISADGRHVAYWVADRRSRMGEVFVYDRKARSVQPISGGPTGNNVDCSAIAISADGRYIAFTSERIRPPSLLKRLLGIQEGPGEWKIDYRVFVYDRWAQE